MPDEQNGTAEATKEGGEKVAKELSRILTATTNIHEKPKLNTADELVPPQLHVTRRI